MDANRFEVLTLIRINTKDVSTIAAFLRILVAVFSARRYWMGPSDMTLRTLQVVLRFLHSPTPVIRNFVVSHIKITSELKNIPHLDHD